MYVEYNDMQEYIFKLFNVIPVFAAFLIMHAVKLERLKYSSYSAQTNN